MRAIGPQLVIHLARIKQGRPVTDVKTVLLPMHCSLSHFSSFPTKMGGLGARCWRSCTAHFIRPCLATRPFPKLSSCTQKNYKTRSSNPVSTVCQYFWSSTTISSRYHVAGAPEWAGPRKVCRKDPHLYSST